MITALVLHLAVAQLYPFNRAREAQRLHGAREANNYAFLEAFGENQNLTPCSSSLPTGARGEVPVCSRAEVMECYGNDGQTLTQVPANIPAVSSGRIDSTWEGIWAARASQNDALYARDQSQVVYVKTNMTCAHTATGMRNDVNGATRCTATGANATVCQTLVRAAATATLTMQVKRAVGTGVVQIDPGTAAYGVNIGASLVTDRWRRAVPQETPGCWSLTGTSDCIVDAALTRSVLNPVTCLKIVTSGDAVDIDFWNDELGDEATPPIATTTVAVPRSLTVCDFAAPFSPTVAGGGFSLAATQISANGVYSAGGTAVPLVLAAGTVGNVAKSDPYVWMYTPSTAGRIANDTSGVVSAGTASYDPFYSAFSSLEVRLVALHTGALINACQEGECAVGSASTLGTPVFTKLQIGRANSNVVTHATAVIKGIVLAYGQGAAPSPTTGPVAWIGDSIVRGVGSLPLTPPKYLTALVGAGVVNGGVGSNTIASCGSRYNSTYAAAGYRTIVWSCAVNDMAAGTAGATAATAAQVYLDDALSRGMKVIVTGIMPWKNSTGWTAGKQTETAAYNSAMSTWAAGNAAIYVSTATMGGQGGDPDLLLTTLDSGDDIHPNSAGASALAVLVNTESP